MEREDERRKRSDTPGKGRMIRWNRERMSSGTQNQTLDMYQVVFDRTISLFLIILHGAAGWRIHTRVQEWLQGRNLPHTVSVILGWAALFAVGAVMMWIAWLLARWLTMRLWLRRNKECYLGGYWYHIFTKDNDPGYLRIGIVRIRQHFYDIEVTAEDIPLGDLTPGEREQLREGIVPVRLSSSHRTTWKYKLSDVDENGNLIAMYEAGRQVEKNRFNRGIQELDVIEQNDEGYPVILQGEFGEFFPSDREGYLELHRALSSNRRKVLRLKAAPADWTEAVNRARKTCEDYRDLRRGLMEYQNVIDLVHSMRNIALDRKSAEHEVSQGETGQATDVDYEINWRIREGLWQLYPNHNFYCEEEGGLHQSPCWVLDAIDGTTNLEYGFHTYSISLALYEEGEIRFGLVYCPYTDETFVAGKGRGAWLNGTRIHVSRRVWKDSLIEIGFGSARKRYPVFLFARACDVFKQVTDIRRICSSSLELCYVACGRADGYYDPELDPWDSAAGVLILEEAGGVVTDHYGHKPTLEQRTDVLASNGVIHQNLLGSIWGNPDGHGIRYEGVKE